MSFSKSLLPAKKASDKYLFDWDAILMWVVAGLLYAAIFAGKFTLYRFFNESSSFDNFFVEIRFLALSFVIFILLVQVLFFKKYLPNNAYPKNISLAVGAILLVQIGLGLHSLFWANPNELSLILYELVALCVVAVLITRAWIIWKQKFIDALLLTGIASALFLGLLAFLGVGHQHLYGPGWAPIGTSISFYRLEAFGAFGSLYFAWACKGRGSRLFFIITACACLVAAFASLSRAALLACSSAFFIVAVINFYWFRIRWGFVVVGILLVSLIVFMQFARVQVESRLTEGLLASVFQSRLAERKIDVELQIPSGTCTRLCEESLRKLMNSNAIVSQARILELLSCKVNPVDTCKSIPTKDEIALLEEFGRLLMLVPDRTYRLRLADYGVRGFLNAPWLGNGFGNYSLTLAAPYTGKPDRYTYPHNIIIELFYAVGVLGVIFVGSVFLFLGFIFFRARSFIEASLPIMGFSIAVLFGSFLGGNYFDFRLVWLGVLLAILMAYRVNSMDGGFA